MIDELASKVFATRDAAHRAHWATSSYAEHMALADFYEALPDAVDELVECYQGQFEMVGDFGVDLPAEASQPTDIKTRLRDDIDWMQAVREDICRDDPSLLNLLDAIVALYQRALYKLMRLA